MSQPHENPTFTDDYPVHKSRPSLTTNASGIAESTMSFASMTTAEGLKRLSQFPPPPPGVPISPFEATLGLAPAPTSPSFRAAYMMTPPTTPPAGPVRGVLPTPQQVFSLPPRRQDSVRSSGSMDSAFTTRTARPTTRPLPVPGIHSPVTVSSPLRSPIATSPTAPSNASQLSPHDWHDGSSSIAVDAYEERMLSTSFITSLLTATDDSTPQAPPPRYKRDYYEPSVASDVMSAESSVTYPPRRMYPDANGAGPSQRPPAVGNMISSTSIPTAGRDTPASLYTTDSHTGVPGGSLLQGSNRSLSIAQSMSSSTPLVQTSFPRADPIQEDQAGEYAAATPTTPGSSSRKRERRQSAYSTRTTKSYVSSLITRLSHSTNGDRKSFKQAAHWFRKKPLPPVPRLPNISMTQEVEYRREEAALPLPDLVTRAQTLSRMLDTGHRPYSHNGSKPGSRTGHIPLTDDGEGGMGDYGDENVKISGVAPRHSVVRTVPLRRNRSQDLKEGRWDTSQDPYSDPRPQPLSKPIAFVRHHKLCVGLSVLAIIIIVIVVAVSVAVTSRRHSQPKCTGNLTGASCSLDATCVCASNPNGQCGNNLAKNLVDLVPTLNSLFSTNYTTDSLYKAIWLAQGDPGSNCANQARLVDVAPGLDVAKSPNRTQWAQAALLWNLVESSSLTDVATLQKFVVSAPWSKLGSPDGAVADSSSSFTKLVSGYNFDFAAQTVTAPPASFTDVGQPSSAQIGQVDSTARSALDRMYSFALASATQQQKALATYWTAVLQQKASDLNQFLSQIRGSQILLPFDATASPGNQPLSALLTNSSTSLFPPPLACYPGLSSTQVQAISTFETAVFGLSSVSAASKFDVTCFPDRPIYGVLDILRLRLPFRDSRTGVPKQAVSLSTQASEVPSRTIVYNGEVLSALPASASTPNLTSTVTDPRRFGSLNHLDHVILEYLQSIPDVNVAIALVEFILQPGGAPPTGDSILFKAIDSLPVLEVAVFGTINPSDVEAVLSSFSSPAGKLFFGTDQSLSVRQWAINAGHNQVVWAELATSSKVVRDNSFTDSAFNLVWNPAFSFFHVPNTLNVGVSNITVGFQAENKFSD